MSEYNAKNYTEQGGEVTHIGGKLVIDAGADISALLSAIADAGKISVCDLTQGFGNKKYSDMTILRRASRRTRLSSVSSCRGATTLPPTAGHILR